MRENNSTAQISNLLLFFEKNDGSLNNDQGEIMRSQCSIHYTREMSVKL